MASPKIVAQAHAFVYWFKWQGHWIYEYRADAVRVLRERGIVGRPAWSAELEQELAAWVAADPLPALAAKWNCQGEL